MTTPRTIPTKRAIVVRGGWDGHQPVEATAMFIPFLEQNGFRVDIFDGTAIYADAAVMATVDLIVQCNTMTTIEKAEIAGLRAAVLAGTGLAGWHGGIADSYRDCADYLQLIGGQFAHHPGKHPSELVGEQSDNYLPYRIDIVPAAADHPIVRGLEAFSITTEQYWVLSDDYIDVLATTTLPAREWDAWNRPITSPAVWTRQWGTGHIFVCTAGHNVAALENASVHTIIERGLLWASR